MERLKKVIRELSDKDFTQIKSALEKKESKKFLGVLVSYREKNATEEKIRTSIKCSKGAYYVLKSRLLDKIQELLVEKRKVPNTISLAHYLYDSPRETAISTLHQLEKNCIDNDIPQELINVLSVLKKAHFYSDKYFHYSQLYNKQIAYTLALEKAEELLFNFNKTLANYFFSRSSTDKEIISFLLKEMKNIYSLNQSHRFELIKNFMLIQCQLFTDIALHDEDHTEDLIETCEQITNNYPNDPQSKYYNLVVSYFWLEYYCTINQPKKIIYYFEIVNKQSQTWLLYNNYCLSFKFLYTKLHVFSSLNKMKELKNEEKEIYFDKYDFYTQSTLKFQEAIIDMYCGSLQESINILRGLIDGITLHHFCHFEIEIKLTLAYLYIKQNNTEMADMLLKNLSRKINTTRKADYLNALQFTKILTLLMNKGKTKVTKNKTQQAIQQFNYCNTGERKILSFLQPAIEQEYK